MLVLAHRGYHAKAPENTLAAFAAAIDLGVDGIETDVRLSADGVAILYHDRLAPNGKAIATLTHRELSQIVGYAVPSLAEALTLTPPQSSWLWNIELKVPEAWPRTRAALQPYPAQTFLVTSFWHPILHTIASEQTYRVGYLMAHCPLQPHLQQFSSLMAPMSSPDIVWNMERLDTATLELAQHLGFRNWVYGSVTAADHAQLLNLPLTGIITDHPHYLLTQTVKPGNLDR